MGFFNCSMFCCALLCVHSSFAIISMRKGELTALLCLSSWCLEIVVWPFPTIPWVCLHFVFVVSSDHTHLLFFIFKLCIMIVHNLKMCTNDTGPEQSLVLFSSRKSNHFRLVILALCQYSRLTHYAAVSI